MMSTEKESSELPHENHTSFSDFRINILIL